MTVCFTLIIATGQSKSRCSYYTARSRRPISYPLDLSPDPVHNPVRNRCTSGADSDFQLLERADDKMHKTGLNVTGSDVEESPDGRPTETHHVHYRAKGGEIWDQYFPQ